jgi:hypothetical protein
MQSKEESPDAEAVRTLFYELLSGARLDGKLYEECENPWEHCRGIVRSWKNANRRAVHRPVQERIQPSM